MPDTLTTIQQVVDPGEKILWHAPAGIWATARRQFGLQTLFILGFIVFGWVFFGQMPDTANRLISIFQIMWFGGLSIVLLGPLRSAIKARSTVLAVTDHRAIIVSGLMRRHVQSFSWHDIGSLEREETVSGYGSIRFQSTLLIEDREGNRRPTDVGFFGIANVRQVEKLLLDLKPPA